MGPRRDWRGYVSPGALEHVPLQASMGPRRDWRGYLANAIEKVAQQKLQWGHAVIGVDTSRAPGAGSRMESASMGPRRDWRGYDQDAGAGAWSVAASMGPRRDWRGYRAPYPTNIATGSPLQWGHAVIGVDTGLSVLVECKETGLQWGHAVIGVDTVHSPTTVPPVRCFNGATP